MKSLNKYTIGVGDRFAHQAKAQLRAFQLAADSGADVVPVWNKSNREHHIVGSEPPSVRAAAQAAVEALGWTKPWHVDADHIGLQTVDRFLECSDFFTLDVADFIGKPAEASLVAEFIAEHPELVGTTRVAGIAEPFRTTADDIARIAGKYLLAVREAGAIYRHIVSKKGEDTFIPEISMDETDSPQTPPELLVILAAIADEGVPVQTIAPKFTGRFNKGVDYVGHLQQFEREFSDDLAVIAHAASEYGLPPNLKLSVHSGSDKFSLYPLIRQALQRSGAGLHLKTAGTTWLEEVIGLAESGGDGLEAAKYIYAEALAHREELCAPYATVVDIRPDHLPAAETVAGWTSEQFVAALRHDPCCPEFNADLRQLLHVGFKVAAKMGQRYLDLLVAHEETIARNVTDNLWLRHLRPLFVG
jgi:hypothetical protein